MQCVIKGLYLFCRLAGILPIGTASANYMESDLGCTSRVYFDNAMLASQKPIPNTITSLIAAKKMLTTFHNKRRRKHAIAVFY